MKLDRKYFSPYMWNFLFFLPLWQLLSLKLKLRKFKMIMNVAVKWAKKFHLMRILFEIELVIFEWLYAITVILQQKKSHDILNNSST